MKKDKGTFPKGKNLEKEKREYTKMIHNYSKISKSNDKNLRHDPMPLKYDTGIEKK